MGMTFISSVFVSPRREMAEGGTKTNKNALVGLRALVGHSLMGRALGPPWTLVGRALMGRALTGPCWPGPLGLPWQFLFVPLA